MSKIGVTVRIDVSKIDKSKLYKGAKGTYLDCSTYIELDEFDQYNNSGFIAQAVSKEEREQGVKGAILGNVKVFYKDGGTNLAHDPSAKQPNPQGQPQAEGFDDDIPF